MTWRQLWLETVAAVGDPDARWICHAAAGVDAAEWASIVDEPAGTRAVRHLDAMVARRRAGEPVAYVTGSWGFRTLDLFVDRRVLIPRPETEQVVDVALGLAREMLGRSPLVVIDLGTGSGAIALSLARELPLGSVEVWGTDLSADALDVARANVAGAGRHAVGVRLAEGDWFEALPRALRGGVDLVVANPPYVADDDPELDDAVRQWEPAMALYAGRDGLDAVRQIVADATTWLRPGGALVMEIGAGQRQRVVAVAVAAGLVDVEVRRDLAGRDRILITRRRAR